MWLSVASRIQVVRSTDRPLPRMFHNNIIFAESLGLYFGSVQIPDGFRRPVQQFVDDSHSLLSDKVRMLLYQSRENETSWLCGKEELDSHSLVIKLRVFRGARTFTLAYPVNEARARGSPNFIVARPTFIGINGVRVSILCLPAFAELLTPAFNPIRGRGRVRWSRLSTCGVGAVRNLGGRPEKPLLQEVGGSSNFGPLSVRNSIHRSADQQIIHMRLVIINTAWSTLSLLV